MADQKQKKEWEDKPATVKIKDDDLTERMDIDEYFKKVKPLEATKTLVKTVVGAEPLVSEKEEKKKQTLRYPKKISLPAGSSIGEILLEITDLTKEKLNECIEAKKSHKDNAEMLGEVLFKKKLITEDDLIEALSIQLNMPIIDLENEEPQPDLVAKVPINFSKKHSLIPVKKDGEKVMVAVANAVDYQPMDDLRLLLEADVKPVLAKRSLILDATNRMYSRGTSEREQELIDELDEDKIDGINLDEPVDLLDSADEAPIIRLVNSLLFRAVKERASDIHFEPFDNNLSVRFRVDGVLYEIMKPPKRAQAGIASRIKIMSQLDIAEKRVPQDGKINIRIAGKDVDIRVSTLPTSFGERIVMRLLDRSSILKDMSEIGLLSGDLKRLNQIIKLSHGIFLVTGPTGSGKTTTLYSALSKINTSEKNVITVEDPVEYQLRGVGQIQVNPKVDLTFASGLRSILRQDPDVIMVGEIRDVETAEIAIQASLTGHLVLSTLHTNDSSTAVQRLIDMGVEPFLVSSSLVAILAQRLVRVLCKNCREKYSPSPEELKEIGLSQQQIHEKDLYRAKGCPQCANTGYSGRTGIYELLTCDDTIKSLILKSSDSNRIKKEAIKKGMKTLRDDGAYKVSMGITSIEEILRVTQEDLVFEG